MTTPRWVKGYMPDGIVVWVPWRLETMGGCWVSLEDGTGDVRAWDHQELSYLRDVLRRTTDPVFFDIGANTGAITMVAAMLPDARCYAFEPNRQCADLLQGMVERNGLVGRVKVERIALGDRNRKATLHVPRDKHSGFAALEKTDGLGECDPQPVLMVTLDDYIARAGLGKIDLLVIDVEGAEPLVISGAAKTLKRYSPEIVMEWWPEYMGRFGWQPDKLMDLMARSGYRKNVSCTMYDRHFSKDE